MARNTVVDLILKINIGVLFSKDIMAFLARLGTCCAKTYIN